MKRTLCLLSLLVCASISCVGPGHNYVMKTMDTKPEIKPDPNKAVLVVFRSILYGRLYAMNSWADGNFLGQTKGRTYFITKIDPGTHYLFGEGGSVTGNDNGCVKIDVLANKVYYIWQGTYPGPSGLRTGFSASSPDDFTKELSSMTYSELDESAPKPVFDSELFNNAKAKYEKEAVEDPNRHKDTQNIKGY